MVLKFMFSIYSKITVVKKKIESDGDDEKKNTTKNIKRRKVNNKMKIKIKYALYAYALLSFNRVGYV